MNHGTWGGEIIRTKNEVRDTPQSQVTDVFMKLPNEDNGGFAFMPVDAWGDLASEVADLPVGSYLEFNGRINTRSYEGNNGTVYVTSLVVMEILEVEVAEDKARRSSKSSTGNKKTSRTNATKSRTGGNNGRSPRQGSKR